MQSSELVFSSHQKQDWGGERKSEERRRRIIKEEEGWLRFFKNLPFCPQSHGEHIPSCPKK